MRSGGLRTFAKRPASVPLARPTPRPDLTGASPTARKSPRAHVESLFAHNFSRVPSHAAGHASVQPKLRISSPGDRDEQEADRTAGQVMAMPEPGPKSGCACGGDCPKCRSKGHASHNVNEALRSPGQALDSTARTFFEPRFGYDFSQVRVHTDSRASQSAQGIDARAYTSRNHIVFAANEYKPHMAAGRQLLAHELTHVVQQGASTEAAKTIHRKVGATSSCPASVHGAPANPLTALGTIDALAQHMALGCRHLLFVESMTFADPTFGPSQVFSAYRDWFGTPEQTSSGRWRSRFRTATFATENEAIAHEMRTLSDRFERLHRWLTGDIRYVCPGTSIYTIPGCSSGRCQADAESCKGSRTIGICPTFWDPGKTDGGRASLLIHEAIHALLRFSGHPTATVTGRGRNPGCYQGFVDTIYNTGALPTQCSVI